MTPETDSNAATARGLAQFIQDPTIGAWYICVSGHELAYAGCFDTREDAEEWLRAEGAGPP